MQFIYCHKVQKTTRHTWLFQAHLARFERLYLFWEIRELYLLFFRSFLAHACSFHHDFLFYSQFFLEEAPLSTVSEPGNDLRVKKRLTYNQRWRVTISWFAGLVWPTGLNGLAVVLWQPLCVYCLIGPIFWCNIILFSFQRRDYIRMFTYRMRK